MFCSIKKVSTTAMASHGNFILCVDDDSDDLFLLEEAIRQVDPVTPIVQFNSGVEAIGYLREAKSHHDLPCVVILDLNMPKMDGKETMQKIKADPALAHVEVVVLTTSSNPSDKLYFEDRGIRMFTKPMNTKELRSIAEIFVQHCK